jgi:hypothetical protein
MNYFAHGIDFLENPYFVAGTAVPDWLNVVNRKSRARSRYALPLTNDNDPQIAAIARGIVQHHFDDDWFHQTVAFNELSLAFAVRLREQLNDDRGFRPSFLGHILVELLLDSLLIEQQPSRLEDYYLAIRQLDTRLVQQTVNRIVRVPVGLLDYFITRFCDERFLADYPSDARLLYRLNGVMKRVGLSELPDSMLQFLPEARQQVAQQQQQLLARPDKPSIYQLEK